MNKFFNFQFLNKINPGIRFLLLLILFALVYSYPSTLLKRPQSVHHWRQSDCTSIALNYYQDGMRFFQPQTHNLSSDGSTSGYSATSEMPVLYYFVAILYKIFGYHDFIFRLLNTLIFMMGLYYLFKSCMLLFRDFFWSAATSLFFFTSPVLVYYGNNFLSDSAAFSFALIGWYFLLRFYYESKQNLFYLSAFFFLLAGANKITALISFVAITIVFITEYSGLFKFPKEGKIFPKPVLTAIPVLLVFTVIASWVLYAKSFNIRHGSDYFSTYIIPLWNMNSEEIQAVIRSVKDLWLNEYFHVSALYFFAAAFLFSLIFIRRTNRFLMFTTIILLGGTILYAILWFATFRDHDYYTINLYILLVLSLLTFLLLLKDRFPKVFSSNYIKFLFLLFLFFNMNNAKERNWERYNGWWTEYPEYKDYHIISPYLRSIGIAPMDTVISLPDMSHFTLYLMNQRGWTGNMNYNKDSASVAASISRGADYLIISGEETLKRDYLQSFLKNQIGQFNSIRIYKIGIDQ